ncbi:MAG: M14 family murein peptide amidase A [Pseudomonadota bacterium]
MFRTTQRNPLKNATWRLVLLSCVALLLTACERQSSHSEDNAQTAEVLADQELVESPDSQDYKKDELSILGEGFYQDTDHVEPAFDTQGAEEFVGNQSEFIGDERDSIVEDFAFSTLDDGVVSGTLKPAMPGPYCLGLPSTETEHTAVTLPQACKRISDRLASVSYQDCELALLERSFCDSVTGFPILFREFPPLPSKKPQGRILVIGGTHGDELTSVSVVFRWIKKLNKYHSGLFHWHIAPMMNPDGVLKRAATRVNENGVDLNRNMPSDDWQANALRYWEDKQGKNPRRYPGEEAASEPETQWLIDEINEFKPDAIISVHAPYGVVDFDSLLLNTAPKSLGKLHLNLLGTYPGSLGNYAGINRNIPVITLELPHAWVMPSEAETTKIWEDIVSWMRKNIGQDIANQE